MAATPRKFSEKIALLNQKEAEGTAEFDRIMREVSVATAQVSQTRSPNLIATSSLSPAIRYRGGSLPNVNNDKLIDSGSPDLNHAGDKEEDLQLHSEHSPQNDRGGSTNDLQMFPDSSGRESRGRSVGGGPMRSRSRNIDTSPYSNNIAYLSPPTDSGWRRTSSDSAIHQSLVAQDHGQSSGMLSPRVQKRISSSQSNSMKNLHQHHHMHQNNHQLLSQQHSHSQQHMNHSMQNHQNSMQNHMMQQNSINNQHLSSSINNLQDMKSRSTKLPNISVYPSPPSDGSLQIPIGNATGSLPDLTLHFPSPLPTPLDQDDDQLIISSSYNTNPSYSMPMASTNMGGYQQQQHPQMSNNSSYSPKHYNKTTSSQGIQQFNQQHATNPITIDQRQPQHSPNHQPHPSYQHHFHDKLASYRNTASPTNLSSSQGNLSKNNISGYRSPHNRPSPGSSPGATQGLATNFDSNSSAPCSPSPHMAGNNGQTFDQFPDNYCINPSIQQHFEQFSLGESSPNDYITGEQNYVTMLDSNGQQQQHSPTNLRNDQSNSTHANSNNNGHQQQQHNNHTNDNLIGNNSMLNNYTMMDNGSIHMMGDDLPGDNGVNDIMLSSGNDPKLQINSSNSSLHTSSSLLISTASPQHLINTNTTTSIPEIIFSDYSSSIEFSKEFLSDNFERPIELELGQMDFAGLQMLQNDSTMIADPHIEDSFRRDLH